MDLHWKWAILFRTWRRQNCIILSTLKLGSTPKFSRIFHGSCHIFQKRFHENRGDNFCFSKTTQYIADSAVDGAASKRWDRTAGTKVEYSLFDADQLKNSNQFFLHLYYEYIFAPNFINIDPVVIAALRFRKDTDNQMNTHTHTKAYLPRCWL